MNVRREMVCPQAKTCEKGFCTHRITHLENGQCRTDKENAQWTNCPSCVEVR